MDMSGAGTAIMLAVAAVLWFVYLLPTWIRRREYLATERNATRLQRAIRVLAESAEAPGEVYVEANAREVLRQEKLLRAQNRRDEAEARAQQRAAAAAARAAEARAAEIDRAARLAEAEASRRIAMASAPVPTNIHAARDGLRRARRLSGLLLLAALVVASIQTVLVVATGISLGAWLVFAAAAATAGVSVALQRGIRARMQALSPRASAPAPRRRGGQATLIDVETAPEPVREWTPVPVPKPLYVERHEPPRVPVVPPISAEQLRAAAADEARRALEVALAQPEVVPFPTREATPPAAQAPSAPSKYASMGMLDAANAAMPDLDDVLRRRRLG